MNAEAALSRSPGQQLASARRAKGLSLADIAHATKIFEARLEAIERDDYSSAGTAPAFVIGYVKAYARQVEVPEKPLIRVLESYFKQRKLTESLEQQVVATPKVSLLRRYFPLLTTAAALLVFIGLGQWFIQREPEPTNDPVSQSSVVPRLDERPELKKRDENLLREEFIESQAAPSIEETAIAEPSDESKDDAVIDSGKGSQHAQVVIKDENQPVADLTELELSHQTSSSLPAPKAGNDELQVEVSGDCWLEIYDANGERVTSRLVKAGSQSTFKGLAPFNVKLGDATVASLSVNGRSVPLEISSGRRVLRLQVGP